MFTFCIWAKLKAGVYQSRVFITFTKTCCIITVAVDPLQMVPAIYYYSFFIRQQEERKRRGGNLNGQFPVDAWNVVGQQIERKVSRGLRVPSSEWVFFYNRFCNYLYYYVQVNHIGMLKHSDIFDRSALCNFVGYSTSSFLLSAYLVAFSKILLLWMVS